MMRGISQRAVRTNSAAPRKAFMMEPPASRDKQLKEGEDREPPPIKNEIGLIPVHQPAGMDADLQQEGEADKRLSPAGRVEQDHRRGHAVDSHHGKRPFLARPNE